MIILFAEFEKEKSEIENNMYSRFLPILNAKKAYISELLSKADTGGNDIDEGGNEGGSDVDEGGNDIDEGGNAKRRRLDFSSSDEDEDNYEQHS